MDGYQIALIVVAVVSAILGGRLRHFVNLLRQSGELLTCIADALEDRKLTKEKLSQILREARDVSEAWANIMNIVKGK